MTRGGLNKNSLSQIFRNNGEVFDKEKESYATWHKRCVLKYFPEKKKQHNNIMRRPALKRYHMITEFKRLCKIDCF